jgi:Lysylphosphatidylglycerol synthase TM region
LRERGSRRRHLSAPPAHYEGVLLPLEADRADLSGALAVTCNVGRLALPLVVVLWTVMIGVVLIPISIGGWGLREVAVISVLATYGVAPERALLFSVCFGLALALGSLPGALAWLLYPFRARSAFC